MVFVPPPRVSPLIYSDSHVAQAYYRAYELYLRTVCGAAAGAPSLGAGVAVHDSGADGAADGSAAKAGASVYQRLRSDRMGDDAVAAVNRRGRAQRGRSRARRRPAWVRSDDERLRSTQRVSTTHGAADVSCSGSGERVKRAAIYSRSWRAQRDDTSDAAARGGGAGDVDERRHADVGSGSGVDRARDIGVVQSAAVVSVDGAAGVGGGAEVGGAEHGVARAIWRVNARPHDWRPPVWVTDQQLYDAFAVAVNSAKWCATASREFLGRDAKGVALRGAQRFAVAY